MELVTVIAGLAVLGVAVGWAVSMGRKHRRERHEVENMFSTDTDDRVWWEEERR